MSAAPPPKVAVLEAEVAKLTEAAAFALAILDSRLHPDAHRLIGATCGEAECWLCGAETMLREALGGLEIWPPEICPPR